MSLTIDPDNNSEEDDTQEDDETSADDENTDAPTPPEETEVPTPEEQLEKLADPATLPDPPNIPDRPPDTDNQASDDDFNNLNDDPALTEEKLQAKLNEYARAFREEFEERTQTDPDNVESYTADFFRKNMSSAMAQMVWLANNASAESVRFNASKYVIEAANILSNKDGDPVKRILNELAGKQIAK